MTYELKHVASVPETKNQPAFAGDVFTYVLAVVSIAAAEGTATAPPDTRAHLCVRPEGEAAWLYCDRVEGLTCAHIEEAFDACIGDPDENRMEVAIKWLTGAEDDALPEFDGW
tara:strand:+ start:137 stop:475 length:339 start_codon:yes stop_codon:yes gene_type:complete